MFNYWDAKPGGKIYKRAVREEMNTPQYQAWRDAVIERDGHQCQMCNRKVGKFLEVHHIKKWSKNPTLRFDPSNGIVLCKKCHKSLWGKEAQFEAYLYNILLTKMRDRIKQKNAENKIKNKHRR